jgi:hypothetical protein
MDFDKDPVKARDSFAQFMEIADEDDPLRKEVTQRLKELGPGSATGPAQSGAKGPPAPNHKRPQGEKN